MRKENDKTSTKSKKEEKQFKRKYESILSAKDCHRLTITEQGGQVAAVAMYLNMRH